MTKPERTASAGAGRLPDVKRGDGLKSTLRGELLRSGDDAYDAARRIHNGMIDRRPAMIVRCAGVADVMRAVKFAREHEVLVSVRGGGHGIAGFAVCDGGMMIDLSQMRSVHVDPAARTATARGGATWGDFDDETLAFGLATTGGVARPTGVAGLTVGRWARLPSAPVWPRLRQSSLGGRGHCRWPHAQGQRLREVGPLLGGARRRREFWHHHFLRIPAPSHRTGAGRLAVLPLRQGRGLPPDVRRPDGHGPGRTGRRDRPGNPAGRNQGCRVYPRLEWLDRSGRAPAATAASLWSAHRRPARPDAL